MSPSICRPPDNPYEITIEEAEQTLMQIMQSMASTKSTESIERKITDRYSIGLKASTLTKSNDNIPYIHVFNFENEAGFAIMSADKRVTPLLSYALKGNLDKDKEIDNPGLATYMSLLEEYVDNVITIDTMQLRLDTVDWNYAGIPDFAVMINGYCPVKWGQEYPYNYYCPTEDGQNTLTGCVATAVAQLMCTYRYPDSYNGYEFDWQEMIDSKKIIEGTAGFDGLVYFLGEPDAGMHQIARLMQQLGLPENLDMNYGKYGSGASMTSILRTLENFGYAKGAIYLSRAWFKGEHLEEISSELEKGYYCLVSGAKKTRDEEGNLTDTGIFHCWLLHGIMTLYDISNAGTINDEIEGKDYFLCNFGWDGYADGFYLAEVFDTDSGPVFPDPVNPPDKDRGGGDYSYELSYIYKIRTNQ